MDGLVPGKAPAQRPVGMLSSASLSLSSLSFYSSETESARIVSIPLSRSRVRSLLWIWSSSCCRSSLRRPPPLSDFCSSVWGIWMRRAGQRRRGSDPLWKVTRHHGGGSRRLSGSRPCLPTCRASGFQHPQPGQQLRL